MNVSSLPVHNVAFKLQNVRNTDGSVKLKRPEKHGTLLAHEAGRSSRTGVERVCV